MARKKSLLQRSERMPLDVFPYSNGEHIPPPPTRKQRQVMALQEQEGERMRRRLGMSRRDFVQSSAAWAVGFWALNRVMGSNLALGDRAPDSLLDDKYFRLDNLPGERIVDIQMHHIEGFDQPWGPWRGDAYAELGAITFNASACQQFGPTFQPLVDFFHSIGQGLGQGVTPESCVERFSMVNELFINSATTMGVLSAFPHDDRAPGTYSDNLFGLTLGIGDADPLPVIEANQTVELVNGLAGAQRMMFHGYAMPNRNAVSLQYELDRMQSVVEQYGDNVGGWKLYPHFGGPPAVVGGVIVPNANPGYALDSALGRAVIEQAIALGKGLVCAHKGITFNGGGGIGESFAACGDIGPIARDYPDLKVMVYHSGFGADVALGWVEGETPYSGEPVVGAYRGDAAASAAWNNDQVVGLGVPADRLGEAIGPNIGTDGLVYSLRREGLSARHFAPGGQPGVAGEAGDGDPEVHANNPNVYGELGGTWNICAVVRGDEVQAAHLIGKLIYYLGPKRVVWGTDSLWGGSPQGQIIAFRQFARPGSEAWRILRDEYHLPHGLEGDVDDPTKGGPPSRSIRNAIFGANAIEAYGLAEDPGNDITLDALEQARDQGLVLRRGTEREQYATAENRVVGYRSRAQLFDAIRNGTLG